MLIFCLLFQKHHMADDRVHATKVKTQDQDMTLVTESHTIKFICITRYCTIMHSDLERPIRQRLKGKGRIKLVS